MWSECKQDSLLNNLHYIQWTYDHLNRGKGEKKRGDRETDTVTVTERGKDTETDRTKRETDIGKQKILQLPL